MLLLLFSGNVSGGVSGSGTAGSLVFTGQSGTAALTGFGAEGSLLFTGQSGIGSQTGVGTAGSVVFTGQSGTASLTGAGVAGSLVFTGQDGTGTTGGDVSGSGTAGSLVFTGQDGTGVATNTTPPQTGDVDLNVDYIRKVYLKRGSKYLIFNTPQEADAFEYAEKQANKAIEQAQKTSRRARKRLREKVYAALPDPEVIDTVDLLAMAANLRVTIDLQSLIMSHNIDQLMQIRDKLVQLQDDEDLEMIMAVL